MIQNTPRRRGVSSVRSDYRRRDFLRFAGLRRVALRFVVLRRELLRVDLRFAVLRFLAMYPTSSQGICTNLVHENKKQ